MIILSNQFINIILNYFIIINIMGSNQVQQMKKKDEEIKVNYCTFIRRKLKDERLKS